MGVVMSRCSLTGSIFKQTFLARVYSFGALNALGLG